MKRKSSCPDCLTKADIGKFFEGLFVVVLVLMGIVAVFSVGYVTGSDHGQKVAEKAAAASEQVHEDFRFRTTAYWIADPADPIRNYRPHAK